MQGIPEDLAQGRKREKHTGTGGGGAEVPAPVVGVPREAAKPLETSVSRKLKEKSCMMAAVAELIPVYLVLASYIFGNTAFQS